MDHSQFLDELRVGQALTQQLHTHLEQMPYSIDQCKSTVQTILSTWEKLISLAQPISPYPLTVKVESPTSVLHSQCKRSPKKPFDSPSKKRKVLPTWTSQVTSTGLEADDGYSWRKYGQKRILGAANPRGYYRCTHRFTQNCQALKIVQRSDEDPSIIDVTYRGDHTCSSKQNGRTREESLLDIIKTEGPDEGQPTAIGGRSPPFVPPMKKLDDEFSESPMIEGVEMMFSIEELIPDFESYLLS